MKLVYKNYFDILKKKDSNELIDEYNPEFYTELKDVTKFDVLAQLAVNMGVSAEQFLEVYESSEAKIQTRAHFNRVYRWGVNTFPSLVAQDASSHRVLTRGYCSSEELRLRIDNWLEI